MLKGKKSAFRKVTSAFVVASFVGSLIFTTVQPVSAASYYYVSTSGSDNNLGTSTAPFRTISKAASVVNPGDTVIVGSGTYNETVTLSRSGSSTGWITYKSQTPNGAKIIAPGTGYSDGFCVNSQYNIINGFDISTASNGLGHGIEILNHHSQVLNCYLHDCGGSGIQCQNADYIDLEGNVCAYNANNNLYQCSGISVYEPIAADSASGYHIFIRYNKCYGNECDTPNNNGVFTDGNGIIIDDFQRTQNPGTPYTYGALVENNICFYNGARGIQVFYSQNCTIRNNICVKNMKNANIAGNANGDLSCQYSDGTKLYNNVVYAAGYTDGNRHAAVDTDNTYGTVSWRNNIIYNGDIFKWDTNSVIDSTTGNMAGVDPRLINSNTDPSTADYHYQSSSPAIDSGYTAFGYPSDDFDRISRPQGSTVDIGAYEYLPAQFLANPGFESGTTSWFPISSSIAVTTGYKHSGNNGLAVTSRTMSWSTAAQDITSALLSHGQGSYNMSLWAKLASGSDGVYFVIKIVDGNGTKYLNTSSTTVGTSFTRVSGSLNITWSGTLTSAQYYVQCANSTNDLYLDDCSLTKN